MLRKIWVPASLMIMAVSWVGCTPAGNQTAEDVSSVRPTDLPGPPSSAGSGGSSSGGMQDRGSGSQPGPPAGSGGDSGYNNGLPGDPMSAGSGGGGNQSGNNTSGGEGNAAVSLPGGSDSAGGGGNSGLPGDPMSAGSGGGGNSNSGGGGTNAAVSLPGGPSSAGSGNGGDNSGLPGNPASAGSGGGGGTNATATVGDGPVSGGGQSGPPPGSNYGGQSGPPPGANYGGQSGPPQGAGGRSGPPPGSNYGGQSGPPPGANYGGQSGPPQGAGGRSGPPPGSNYGGQSGPPPGANYGGQSGPPQGAGGTGIAGPSSAGSGGGQQGGSDSSASASIPGGGGQATGGQSTGGSGGASMSLDGGDWAPPGAGNFPGAGQRPGQQGPQAPAKVEEKSFYDMAMNAFAGGRDVDGYRYLQAEFAANRARFDEMPLSFLPAQKGTTLGLRMGIGIQYTAGQGVTGKAPVIGDAPPSNAGGRGNNFGPGASSGFGPGSGGPGGGGSGVPRDAKGMLEYYGGDLSKSLLAKLEERFRGSPPTYGSIWPQLNLKVLMVEQDGNSSFVSNQNSGGGGGFGLPGGPSASGSSGGSFAGYGGQANAGPPEGLYPGLVFLGEANYAELLSRAKKERLDGLFIVDQRANMVPRTGQLTSQTEVKFYVVAEGKERASTSSLNYAMVSQKRSGLSDNSKDPVEKELASVFNKVDRMFVATPMPELTEELATGRLKSIMATAKEEPLPFVAEVNFYIQKGWLNEEDGQNMIIEVLGEAAALTLWSGDFAKQKEALKRWLPREAS